MKKMVLLSYLVLLAACDQLVDIADLLDDNNGTDSDSNSNTGLDTNDAGLDTNTWEDVDLTECSNYPQNTCSAVIGDGEPERCIADFNYGTTQAGNSGTCTDYCGYDKFVGVYGYNDNSSGAVQIPPAGLEASEPSVRMPSCDPNDTNYALHFQASGFVDWGAAIALDWGGPLTEWCNEEVHPGVLDCLGVTLEDSLYTIESAMSDVRCQRDNPNEEQAMEQCLMWGKYEKRTRDLSDYIGIGFWVLAMDDHEVTHLKVSFPIPATTRFYGNELLPDGEPKGCTDEDLDKANQCFNHYSQYISFNPNDRGKWVYKEVLFDQLEWSTDWGFQLDTLGYIQQQFPANESMGLALQADRDISSHELAYTNFYIDDIILLK